MFLYIGMFLLATVKVLSQLFGLNLLLISNLVRLVAEMVQK